MKPTLVVLAAGMGSRYGGLKQIDPVGPSGEVILDYSVYDALRAGFGKIVFVIRRDIEEAFKQAVGSKYLGKIEVAYAFQQLDDLPDGAKVPEGREKPWGTAHAVLAARHAVDEPFGVINADDFYGRQSFQRLGDSLRGGDGGLSLIGFRLDNTVSEHGTVSRGLCRVDGDGRLREVVECHGIRPVEGGIEIRREGKTEVVDGDRTVSMNMWGFPPDFFGSIQRGFAEFLREPPEPLKSEYYIPTVVQDLVDRDGASVKVVQSPAIWLGVTYPDDKPLVRRGIADLVAKGEYPDNLWG